MIIEDITAENFPFRIESLVLDALIRQDLKERARMFTDIMDTARACGVAEQVEETAQLIAIQEKEPELWELPQSFEKEVALQPFPVSCLPNSLSDYLKAVCDFIQVAPEMGALPLLSTLSLCLQGKAVVQHPGGNHTENLNLYTLTVAQPGERKSGVFHAFTAPIFKYQTEENERRKGVIADYKAEKQYLENQLASATKGNNVNPQRAKEISRQISELKPVFPLLLNVSDVTPEALAWEMFKQGGRMAVINDEGGIFEILSGLYSGGSSNIDLILKAYDGSPYTVIRRTKENIELKNPLLTVGIMAQPSAFEKVISNPEFLGRGFIQRFLFSFPESRAGSRSFSSPEIPQNVQRDYDELITRLLSLKNSGNMPVIRSNNGAYNLFKDYFDYIEERLKPGGQFEHLKEWANKQFARCLKIAGILHLCEHTADELLDEQTAMRAVNIAIWAENQALKAFSGAAIENENTSKARYIVSKIKDKRGSVLTEREILRACRKFKSITELEEPLFLLCDMNYLQKKDAEHLGTGRKPCTQYRINPLIE